MAEIQTPVSNIEACTCDMECLDENKHNGLSNMKTKICSCNPVSEQLPSNVATMVDAKCSNDGNCKGLPTSLLSQ
ncbi:hypothetical protein GOBAR_DD23225 [Gossypium barbadense]|nr:hypothetical protein GOBAR_DD23225 [Gossypium barbadense]